MPQGEAAGWFDGWGSETWWQLKRGGRLAVGGNSVRLRPDRSRSIMTSKLRKSVLLLVSACTCVQSQAWRWLHLKVQWAAHHGWQAAWVRVNAAGGG
jgi:hypothetical protein